MQYDPKLKKAMMEIRKTLEFYDIGASVVLHSPGHAETYMKVDPSYSCAFIHQDTDGSMGVRVRSRLAEDHGGDAAKQHKIQEDTVNMFDAMAEHVGKQALNFMDIMKMLEKKFEITRTDRGFTSDSTQNN